MKTIGFIFSAGKEKRFLGDKPKALQNIFGFEETILEHNVNILRKCCDDVVVVVNQNNEHYFKEYNHIVIDSGNGCGDAVLKAQKAFFNCGYDFIMIQWGDCYLFEDVVKKSSVAIDGHDIVIPCHYEKRPYVRLLNFNGSIKVEFGKYNEVKGSGFHDFGFFYGKFDKIQSYLEEFAKKYKCRNGYKHRHGNEFQFLDMINESNIIAKLLLIVDTKPISFNTNEELKLIKWV